MQRIAFGSPHKENITQSSPSKKNKTSPLAELITFLKNSNFPLPSNICKIVGTTCNPESPPKKALTNRENQEDPKRLKVQLTDLQFQFKKIEEDFAQFKRNSKCEKQKQARKNEETISKLKVQLESTTEDSSYSLSKAKENHQQQINSLKEKSRLELEQEKNKLIEEYESKLNNGIKIHQRQLTERQHNFDRKFKEKVESFQAQITRQKQQFEKQKKEAALKYKQTLQERQKKFESIRVAIESEKKTQQRLHEKTKLDSSKEKQKLLSQLCFQKNTRVHLQEQLQERQKEIRRLKSVIRDKEEDLILLQQRGQKKLQKARQQFNLQVDNLQKQQAEYITALKKSQLQELTQIQSKLSQLERLQAQKEQITQAHLEELSLNFQRRPSKKEDLAEMDKMKWALTRREEEIRKLTKDIKYCNLELQNKEDLYTRIFRGNSMSREKRQKEKDEKEQQVVEQKIGRQIVFRKSATSDIKFLLKHYKHS